MADNVELAYLAGFFDGEGTLGIYRFRSGRPYKPRLSCRLAVDCSAGWPADRFVAAFGGYIDSRPNRQGTPMVRWRLQECDAIERAVTSLLPFLTVKASQARIMLAYLAQRHAIRLAAHRKRLKYTAEQDAFLDTFVVAIKGEKKVRHR